MNIPYLVVNGTITAIVKNKTYTAKSDHFNFDKIKKMLCSASYDLDGLIELFDISRAINNFSDGLVTVTNGLVQYAGAPIHDLVTERIVQFMSVGQDIKPIVNFLKLRQSNPSFRAAQELYKFLEHKHMPIGPDGFFYAYKGVRADYKDKYTGTIDNHVGQSPWMARSLVCDDPQRPCSPGFHAGSLKYASDWAGSDGRVMIVKINPSAVVNIPYDCEFQKLKMYTYEVVGEQVNREPLNDNYTNQFDAPPKPAVRSSDDEDDYNDGFSDGSEDYADDMDSNEDNLNVGSYKDGYVDGYHEHDNDY